MGLTLEKEAVERVLLQEQAEVRLLQQELGVMAQVADALEESQAQLQVGTGWVVVEGAVRGRRRTL